MSLDDARLLPHLRVDRRGGDLPPSAALDDVLEAKAEIVRRRQQQVFVPSLGEGRGVPIVGNGPGASPGSNPAAALMAKERRRR